MADQRHLVVLVEDQHLARQVDLDAQPAPLGDQHGRQLRAGQRPLHGRVDVVGAGRRGQPLDLLERPDGFEGAGAELPVHGTRVIVQLGQPLLQSADRRPLHPRAQRPAGRRGYPGSLPHLGAVAGRPRAGRLRRPGLADQPGREREERTERGRGHLHGPAPGVAGRGGPTGARRQAHARCPPSFAWPTSARYGRTPGHQRHARISR